MHFLFLFSFYLGYIVPNITTIGGRKCLIYRGQRFCNTGTRGNRTYWRCAAYQLNRYKCKARLISERVGSTEMALVKCPIHTHVQKYKKKTYKKSQKRNTVA